MLTSYKKNFCSKKYSRDLNTGHSNNRTTVGIQKLDIWIPKSFENQTFWRPVWPLDNPTHSDHLNSGHARYSGPHWLMCLFGFWMYMECLCSLFKPLLYFVQNLFRVLYLTLFLFNSSGQQKWWTSQPERRTTDQRQRQQRQQHHHIRPRNIPYEPS